MKDLRDLTDLTIHDVQPIESMTSSILIARPFPFGGLLNPDYLHALCINWKAWFSCPR